MIRLSLSETDALCFKAARGAGLDWGEAEEAGWAAAWLSRAGLSGPSITLAWLTAQAHLARPRPAPGHWAMRRPETRHRAGDLRAHCPLRTGIALADFAGLPEGLGGDDGAGGGAGARALTVDRVAYPRLALPFIARAAARIDICLEVRWGSHRAVFGPAGIAPGLDLTENETLQATDLRITQVDPRHHCDTAQTGSAQIRSITRAEWQALEALARRITVPASAQSRAGAGAAGSDND